MSDELKQGIKTSLSWVELAAFTSNPTDTESLRRGLCFVGTELRYWSGSAWTAVAGGGASTDDADAIYNQSAWTVDVDAYDVIFRMSNVGYNMLIDTNVTGTTANLLTLDAKHAGATVTDALKITVSTGVAITTALNMSDAKIVTALDIGANAIAGTNFNVSAAGAIVGVGMNAGTGKITGTGNIEINGTKFVVTASNGNTDTEGTLGCDGDFKVAATKFIVLSASGNTTVAGTLDVAGTATLAGDCGVTGDLTVSGNFSFGGILTMGAEVRMDGNAIYFDADDDSGIYSSADNQIDVNLNGSTEYSFKTAALDMASNALDNTGYIVLNTATLSGISAEVYIGHDNSGDLTLNAKTNKDVIIATGGTDRMFLDEAGIAFQQASTISTSATTLTLSPATDVVVANGKGLIVGGATQYSCGGVTAELEVTGTAGADGSLTLYTASATANAGLFLGRDKAATLGGHDVVVNNDVAGDVNYCVDDGTDTDTIIARVRGEVDDAAPAASDIGGALVFMTASGAGANDIAEKLRINAAGNTCVANGFGLFIGTETQVTTQAAGEFQIHGTAVADATAILGIWSADAVGSQLNFVKSRNTTIGSSTVVADDDVLGTIAWHADDGTDFVTVGASIYAEVDDASITTSQVGTALVISTAPGAGADDLAERIRIFPSGQIYLNCPDATKHAAATLGLIIDTGANDDQALVLKSSDVATVLTSIVASANNVETDDWMIIEKLTAAEGGVRLSSLSENAATTVGLLFEQYGGQADATKSTAGRSLIEFYASQHDGANALSNIGANGNVFGIRARRGGADVSLALFDEDGDLWLGNALDATTAYFTTSPTSRAAMNFVAAGGGNNAISATLNDLAGSGVPLTDGLTIVIDLGAYTLQAGANTFNLNAGGALSIVSHYNVASNIGTAYAANGFIVLTYNATSAIWMDMSQ